MCDHDGHGLIAKVGAVGAGTGASQNTTYYELRHRFVPPETDASARLTFNLAQSAADVQIDYVGIYEGRGCGAPSPGCLDTTVLCQSPM